MEDISVYDDLIIGAGMAGLAVGSLLARAGRKVLILEAHELPGGYAHTFHKGPYAFCAQVQYVFNCGEGEPVYNFLEKLGLVDEVTWKRLDPEGFDVVSIAGERYRFPNGLAKSRDRLVRKFPEHAGPLRAYFEAVARVRDELQRMPEHIGVRDLLVAPIEYYHLLRYRAWTLQDFYDEVGMPPLLQGILAGQCGDYFLPPERVAFLIHVGVVAGYDRGAYYPEKHFEHFIDSVAGVVDDTEGCDIRYEEEVDRIVVENGQAVSVHTRAGDVFRARRFISNVDPARTARLAGYAGESADTGWRREYEYSASAYTLYLGLKDIDLRDHGFGNFNIWHYPDQDINAIYRKQHHEDDLSDPWLFISSPSLMTETPGLCPEGQQVLHLITSCNYRTWKTRLEEGPSEYRRAKAAVLERILDILERDYVPDLRKHVAFKMAGTPTTNERFVWSPKGNAYGAALTPGNISLGRRPFRSPVENLWVVNATAGYPGIAGTIRAAMTLYEELTGDAV